MDVDGATQVPWSGGRATVHVVESIDQIPECLTTKERGQRGGDRQSIMGREGVIPRSTDSTKPMDDDH